MNSPLLYNYFTFNDYYNKPNWWFRLRYDTQIKRKTCLYLLSLGNKLKQSNISVLDIGFGSGSVIFSFSKDTKIFGLEISKSAIERATQIAKRKGYLFFDFKYYLGGSFPFESEMFDVIIASHVLEHIENLDIVMREIWRVAKKDAEIVILIPINEKYHDPNHVHKFTTKSFIEIAENYGFTLKFVIENELLFHIVEKFYAKGYRNKWKILGLFIASIFNIPASLLPFSWCLFLDKVISKFGYKPRQAGFLLKK